MMSNPTLNKSVIQNSFNCKSLDFLNCDFFSQLGQSMSQVTSDEKSKAKQGQTIMVYNLSKNLIFLVAQYLKCNELYSFILSSAKIYKKITQDPFFKQVSTQTYSRFFFQ